MENVCGYVREEEVKDSKLFYICGLSNYPNTINRLSRYEFRSEEQHFKETMGSTSIRLFCSSEAGNPVKKQQVEPGRIEREKSKAIQP